VDETMSTGLSTWRQRRMQARTRRALGRALDAANTPSMQQELIALAGARPWNVTH
jgi:hypothetical protein